jgi:large subunit ribosomal protein L18
MNTYLDKMGRLIKVRPKRRRQGKTDYKARLALLKSGLPRLVVRKTNKYIITQIVKSKEAKDFTSIYANSRELAKLGWKFSFKNLPAAYLTGLLIGKKALSKKIDKVVLDQGLVPSTRESKIYAVIRGALDSGLKVACSEKILPSEDRISGKHIPKNPQEINKNFLELKNKIMSKE